MSNIEDARKILSEIGMPISQQNDMCALTLMALAGVGPNDDWQQTANDWMRVHDILDFDRIKHGVNYAENSRETIRKQALHYFRDAALIEDNGKATNSPKYAYRLTQETADLLRTYGTLQWKQKLYTFRRSHAALIDLYASKRKLDKVPVRINGQPFTLSKGKHNQLQKAVIEEFGSRFAPGAECLYLGDTADKDLVKNETKLENLGVSMTSHDKLPDIILHDRKRNRLLFIEAVTSVGPMSPQRIHDIRKMTKRVSLPIIFVTAFLDRATYKKFLDNLAWETEVWLAESPEHMIHLNGDKFLL